MYTGLRTSMVSMGSSWSVLHKDSAPQVARHCDTQEEVPLGVNDVVHTYVPQWLKRPHNLPPMLPPWRAANLRIGHLTDKVLSVNEEYCFVAAMRVNARQLSHQPCCLSPFEHLTLLLIGTRTIVHGTVHGCVDGAYRACFVASDPDVYNVHLDIDATRGHAGELRS